MLSFIHLEHGPQICYEIWNRTINLVEKAYSNVFHWDFTTQEICNSIYIVLNQVSVDLCIELELLNFVAHVVKGYVASLVECARISLCLLNDVYFIYLTIIIGSMNMLRRWERKLSWIYKDNTVYNFIIFNASEMLKEKTMFLFLVVYRCNICKIIVCDRKWQY